MSSRRSGRKQRWRRQNVFSRWGASCFYCGKAEGELTLDHVVPLARGGTSRLGNLVPCCKSCNQAKGDQLVEEWLA